MSISSKEDLKQKLIKDDQNDQENPLNNSSNVKVHDYVHNQESSFRKEKKETKEIEETDEEKLKKLGGPIKTSYLKSNICSKLLFCWPTKLFSIAKNISLKTEYLGKIDDELSAETYSKNAISYWQKNKTKYSLFRSILNLNFCKLLFFVLICLFVTAINIVNIKIIQNIIIIFSNDPEKKVTFDFGENNRYVYCGSFVFLKFIYIMIFRQGTMIEYILSYKAGLELISIIYDKILTATLSGKKKLASEGEMVNYIQIDAYKIISTITQSPTLITNPIQVVVYNVMLFQFFGFTYIYGLATLILFFGFNYIIFKGYRTSEEGYLKCKDARMKITNQVFNHLKILKFNSWTNEFKKKINEKRDEEMKHGKNILNLSIWNIFLFWTSPVLTTIITIGVYFYVNRSLEADIIFTSLNIFSGIQDPLREIPSSINSMIDLFISLKRIEKFLNQEDRDKDIIKDFDYKPNNNDAQEDSKDNTKDLSLRLKNCSFSWGNKKSDEEYIEGEEQKLILKNINLEVKKGEFIGIIGEVGSGKSSLLQMILNNMMPIYSQNYIKPSQEVIDSSDGKNKSDINKNEENDISNDNKNNKNDSKDNEEIERLDKSYSEGLQSQDIKKNKDFKSDTESLLDNANANTKILQQEENLIQIRGSISYVSQTSWIQNATVKDNILLFKQYEKELYDKVVEISELKSDLKILSGGDLTEIGEKGINLSGGQKTRVSLARAAYSNSDIYLLDDPLAALDGNVGKNIFHKLLQEYLKEKTKILVTNNINYLEYLDKIVLLKSGNIAFQGTFEEFKRSKEFEDFANYLKKDPHTKEQEEDSKKENDDESKIEEIIIKKLSNDKGETDLSEKNAEDKNNNNDDNLETQVEEQKETKLIRDEDKETGRVKATVYLDYIKYNGGLCMILSVIMIMLSWQLLKVGSDFWMSIWIKGPIFENDYYNFGMYAGLSFISNLFVFFRLKLLVVGTIKMCISVHEEMLEALTKAPINLYHDIEPKGRILNRLSKDLEYISYIMFGVGNFLSRFFLIIGVLGLCSYYIYYLLGFVPVLFGIGWYVCNKYMYASRELTRIEGLTRSKLLNIVSETLPGITTILSENKQEFYRGYLNKTLSEINLIEIYFAGTNSWFGLILDFQSFLFLLCIHLFIMFFPDHFTKVTIGLILTYSNNLSESLFFALSSVSFLENSMVSLERCVSYTKIVEEQQICNDVIDKEREDEKIRNSISENTNNINNSNVINSSKTNNESSNQEQSNLNDSNNIITSSTNKQIVFVPENWPLKGDVVFENFSVKYRPNTPIVLKNLSISIRDGEKIGVVGRTGSGKSTLCLCLFRILEAFEGRIKIDNLDISQVPLDYLRSKLTIIPQDSAILDGTLRFNIDPINICKDEEIIKVLENIGLWEILKEKNVNTEITEDSLSVGERQLICIARAIIRKSKIILTDEATASIDLVTEEKIQKAFVNYFEKATIITIAHRIKTVVHSDKILVLDKGEVVEFGSPSELLNDKEGIFYSLYNNSVK